MQKTDNDVVLFLLITSLLIVIMASFIVTVLYFYRKRQIIYQRDLEKIKSEFEKNILGAQLEIQEQTLQNISREIHDHICLNLTLAKLNLITLNHEDRRQTSDLVNSSIGILGQSIQELSDLAHGMDTELLESHGLIAALKLEVEKIQRLKLFDLNMKIRGNPIFIDCQKELVVFRIIQESFNNVLKHAGAKNVSLHLFYDRNHMEAFIQDDGVGFSKEKQCNNGNAKHQSGLTNMQKRARLINGNCNITSEIGKGTSVHLSIPF